MTAPEGPKSIPVTYNFGPKIGRVLSVEDDSNGKKATMEITDPAIVAALSLGDSFSFAPKIPASPCPAHLSPRDAAARGL